MSDGKDGDKAPNVRFVGGPLDGERKYLANVPPTLYRAKLKEGFKVYWYKEDAPIPNASDTNFETIEYIRTRDWGRIPWVYVEQEQYVRELDRYHRNLKIDYHLKQIDKHTQIIRDLRKTWL